MKIQTRGKGVVISKEVLSHIDRRIYFALGRFVDQIEQLRVLLGDINGPKNDVDKGCRITVCLRGNSSIRIEQVDEDILSAINTASDRIGRLVARRLDRTVTLAYKTKQNKGDEHESQ